ncbi:MAG: PKD domain-containing protein [Candidatus Nanohaloarchaea archaeon]
METGQYEIDTEMLGYWILGLSTVLVVSGLYIADFSPDFLTGGDEEPDLEVEFDKRPLEPNELTTLTVSLDGENVQGATVRLDNLNVGETNRNGKLMVRGLENDFPVNVSYDGYYTTDEISVEEDASETREASDDSDQGDSNQDDSGGSDDSDGSDESSEDSNNDSEDSDDQDDSQDSDDGSDDEKGFTGFRLDSSPVAEETNRLTLLENGEALGNQQVQLNGDNLGETTTAGGLTFQVPNTQEMTLKASTIEETFQVEGYEERESGSTGDITPVMERSGMEYAGETVTFDASGTESQNEIASYNWTFDHENFNDTLQGETVDYTIPEEGAYDIVLEVKDANGFTETDTDFMRADPEYSGPEIILASPSDGDTVTAEHEFEFQVDNARTGQEAHVVVNGDREASVPLEPGLNIREDTGVTAPIPQAGVQEYWIEVEDSTNTWESSKREIENTRAYGNIGAFSIDNPSDNAEASSPVNFEFSLDLETNVNLRISGEGINGEEQFSNQTSISADQNSYTFNQDLNATEYNWQASINVPSTSESEYSSDRTLTVQ